MKIGDYVILPCNEGTLHFDGGISFGAIPRTVWSRIMEPDEDNRVAFGNCFFLVQGQGRNVLVDTGIGTKLSEEQLRARRYERDATADELLESAGLVREDIHHIVLTHLHYASAGNLTFIDDDGVLQPTFPNAVVLVQQGEWEKGIHSNIRTRALYHKEDFEPLLWHQKLELVDGDREVLPGLWLRKTGGHTEDHQIVVIESGDEGAIFWGDLIPSTHHLYLNAISAHDLEPMLTMERKAEWLEKAIRGGWVHFFSRDPEIAAGLVKGDVRKRELTLEPLLTH